jgi:hypothetical protein
MFQPRQDQETAFIENELALQTYRRVPQHLPSPAGPRHFHAAACSARGSGNLVHAHINASHLMSR